MRVRIVAACFVLRLCSLSATAQMGGAASGPAVGGIATPAMAYDSELTVIEGEMMSAVKAMPAEKFNFAPSAAIFASGQTPKFDTVRTFAEQAVHVARANYLLYGIISGLKPDVDVAAMAKLTKKDEIVAALAGSFAYGHKAIASLTVANAFEVVKSPEPGLQTRATLTGFGIEHGFDHYGQMVEYLRMNGIVPPASAK
jgi:uncharacterized damage-inducible protein DinB